jgi:hypothetical protein
MLSSLVKKTVGGKYETGLILDRKKKVQKS